MDTTPILVLGATGSAGRRVAARLKNLGAPVREASRHGATRFDWDDQNTWEPALTGADRMFLMAPDGVPVNPDFVHLAAELKVHHIVLLSSRGIETIGDRRLLDAEESVRSSGTAWTILRADWFDQNFDEGPFREAVLGGEIAVPLQDTRQAFMDLDDLAAVAAVILTEDGHTDRTYEVTGPRAMTFTEVCATLADAAGRPVAYHGDESAYRAAQREIGRDEDAVDRDIASFAALRAQGDATVTDTVPHLTGHQARPFEQYAARSAATGCWRGEAGEA
ncbi:NmrA family NAD(P)-binding protein [Streptomyces lichenis]|uniref:NmrA-like domain-containing protein n=1 Tax=Streptomyces lichenis TaxID=2306967 RepID=A0ABT0IDV0_9ACTN|nr:NmrA family NAD(P)-binding protein [Streptomyces lichenis]MCK8679499.1 hypothetical protein [Streptomyces lichenis]